MNFKNWLHNKDPWAFRVSDAVFSLFCAGALAFVWLGDMNTGDQILSTFTIGLGWLFSLAMNH